MIKNAFYALSLFLLLKSTPLNSQILTTTLRGQVIEKATQLPIPAARVTVMDADSSRMCLSDNNGYFKIDRIAIGRRAVKVSSVGFQEQVLNNLVLTSAKDFVVTVALEESLTQLQEVVISATDPNQQGTNVVAAVSTRQVKVEEARRYAGNFQDIARMATNFAGVTAPNDQNNDIVVRGNAPIGVLWRLEGVDIPTPAHLAFVGTEGGFSILNFNTLAQSDFLSGAFPAEYGNRNAAVFDLRLRRGNSERYEFTGQIGVAGLEFGAEGPLSRQKVPTTEGGQVGSFLVSYRFFDLQNLQKLGLNLLSDLNGFPSFQDLTFKVYQPLRNNGSLTFFGVGGLSTFIRKNSQQDNREISNTGVVGLSFNHYFSKKWRGTLWLALSGNATKRLYNEANSSGVFRLTQDLNMSQSQGQVKYELNYRPTSRHLFKMGVSVLPMGFELKRKRLSNNILQTSFSDSGVTALYQSYLHWQYRMSEKWTTNTGVYAHYFAFNATQSVEPRLSVRYRMSSQHQLAAAIGWHSQTQPLVFYTRQFTYPNKPLPVQTNSQLDLTRSRHIVIGHDWFLGKEWRLKSELYRQDMSDVPVRRGNPIFSALNAGAAESSILNIPDSLINAGEGYNQGVEWTLEKFFSKNYYVLTTLSVYASKFKTPDGGWRNTAFGHRYVWNILGGYEWAFGKNKRNALSLDYKMNFLGGKPYIPVDLPNSMRRNTYVPDMTNAYLKRLPHFNRIDIKIAWRLNRANATHFLYLELNNILNAQSYLEAFYDNATKTEQYQRFQLGFLPLGGYRIEWGKTRSKY